MTCVSQSKTQKHLGIFLDSKLDFKGQMQNGLNNVSKTKGLLRRPTRQTLITSYKSFKRPHLDYGDKSFKIPHLDYGDIIYDQTCNVSFHQKLQSNCSMYTLL